MVETVVLPVKIVNLLNGMDLEQKQNDAMLLITVSEEGWPHAAMISVGEIAAINEQLLRLSLWKGTRTAENLLRTGKATLVVILEGKAYYLKMMFSKLESHDTSREKYAAAVMSVKEDIAKYAVITTGIKFKLKEPEEVIRRWDKTIKELKNPE
ncbi:pyridoxamine 5'-phosphate oxidase family protein [Neobacillus sp. Marseille-QA0830]